MAVEIDRFETLITSANPKCRLLQDDNDIDNDNDDDDADHLLEQESRTSRSYVFPLRMLLEENHPVAST